MQINRAKEAGFCPGVRRAVELALGNQGKKLYLLGEIVHNRSVVEKLKEEGIETIEDWRGISPASILIRSHGLAPSEKKELEAAGWEVHDATCPWVKQIHARARQLVEEGYPLFLIGEPNHPEVKAFTRGDYGEVKVLSSVEEAASVKIKKAGVVMQSTFSPQKAGEILGKLYLHTEELKAFRTLCRVTSERVSAALQLAGEVDMMIVIGGKNSSNTRQLTEACKGMVPTYQIETADEIQEGWLRDKTRIGVTAGASTPDWIIEDVIRHLAP
ncbi:MAG: 4-hydroxy-3-methylbut-2-enyl diphosphate reductase [Bacteroidota bacterium]